MPISFEEMRDILKLFRDADPRFAVQEKTREYLDVLSEYRAHEVKQVAIQLMAATHRAPTPEEIRKGVDLDRSMMEEPARLARVLSATQEAELMVLEGLLTRATLQGDNAYVRELLATISQIKGQWRPKSNREIREHELAKLREEIRATPIGAQKPWMRDVADVITVYDNPKVPDEMVARIALAAINKLLSAGEKPVTGKRIAENGREHT